MYLLKPWVKGCSFEVIHFLVSQRWSSLSDLERKIWSVQKEAAPLWLSRVAKHCQVSEPEVIDILKTYRSKGQAGMAGMCFVSLNETEDRGWRRAFQDSLVGFGIKLAACHAFYSARQMLVTATLPSLNLSGTGWVHWWLYGKECGSLESWKLSWQVMREKPLQGSKKPTHQGLRASKSTWEFRAFSSASQTSDSDSFHYLKSFGCWKNLLFFFKKI